MNRSADIAKISAALVKAQSEMGNATKGASNPFFKSKFADLNSVREATIPVLNAHGISVLQPTVTDGSKSYVETLLLHESGEYLSGQYEIVYGKANDPQAFGAAVSYARRYSLQAMLNIGAEDDDAESAMGRGKAASNSKPAQAHAAPAKLDVESATAGDLIGSGLGPKTDEAPVKKGGFGVKKTEVVSAGSEDGWS